MEEAAFTKIFDELQSLTRGLGRGARVRLWRGRQCPRHGVAIPNERAGEGRQPEIPLITPFATEMLQSLTRGLGRGASACERNSRA